MKAVINNYSFSIFLCLMTLISYPFFLKNMLNPKSIFSFFFLWSVVTSFAHEFLINKAFLDKEGYKQKKAIMILVQTFLVAGMLLFCIYFFSK